MLRLVDATVGVFVCHSRHNGTEILKVRVFMVIEHYDMLQETCTCGLKYSAVRNLKPEYAKRTRLVFSSMMSIKHAFAYQKSRFSFRKNGYTSDKKTKSKG